MKSPYHAKAPHRFVEDPDESVVAVWTAAVPFGKKSGLAKYGGKLILTSQRLVFDPLPAGVRNANVSSHQKFESTLSGITNVVIDPLRNSGLVISASSGSKSLIIGGVVFMRRENRRARDEAVSIIQDRLQLGP